MVLRTPNPGAIIRFTPEELHSITIRYVARQPLSSEYVESRERVWATRLDEATRQGKTLWNGELYTIESLERGEALLITMSTCEFKDVVFRIARGLDELERSYGVRHVPRYVTVDCIPVTSDGRFVFGVRNRGTNVPGGSVGLIGGTLNRDEMHVNTFDDITRYMRHEIEEETTLVCPEGALKLFSLNRFEGKFEFLFTWQLDVPGDTVASMSKPAEFQNLLALECNEALRLQNGLDAYRFAKAYLHELVTASSSARARRERLS